MNKIIKNDNVIVLSGKDKGKVGRVVKVVGDQVIVENINTVKKHRKSNRMQGLEGGIVSLNMPLHISNIAIWNPYTQKADKVAIKIIAVEGGFKRVRIFKSSGIELVKDEIK